MKLKNILTTVAVIGGLGLAASAQAVVVDLTTANSSGTANGAQFVWIDQGSTGTGVIEPFLRLQNSPTEEGYNTSGTPYYSDVKTGIWTHDLLLTDVPIVTIGGVQYRQFLLDINENKSTNGELLTLNSVKIALGNVTSPTTAWGTFGTQVFDLDSNEDNTVKLNYSLNPGSGYGDMFMYVRNSLFTGGQYVYFYSQFGSAAPYESDAGFEEWAVLKGTTTVPEPATLGLLGLGLAGVGFARRRKIA